MIGHGAMNKWRHARRHNYRESEMTNKRAADDEAWEFGSIEWCAFAAEVGISLIRDSDIDLSRYEWGFSECYLHVPDRIANGATETGYHFMISNGSLSGGLGTPPECLALDGFHVRVPWGAIAHASSFQYGRKGQRERSEAEAVMWRQIGEAVGWSIDPLVKPAIWPQAILAALSANSEMGGGLHNLTSARLKPSHEVCRLPQTTWGVPCISQMSALEKSEFMRLLGI